MKGKIGWIDLTVKDADSVKEFYQSVVGWEAEDVSMGDYNDYSMKPSAEDDPVAGICHAMGSNADLPHQWMIYIVVSNLMESVAKVEKLGGEILVAPRPVAGSQFAVIKDPAGAICALYQDS